MVLRALPIGCLVLLALHALTATADLIDVVQDPGTMHSSEVSISGANQVNTDAAPLVYDGDYGSSWLIAFTNNGTGGGGNLLLRSIHAFAAPSLIDSITFRARSIGETSGTTDRQRHGHIEVDYQLYGSTDWLTVAGSYFSFSGGGDGSNDLDTGVVTLSDLGLSNVAALRLEGAADAFANNGPTNGSSAGRVYLYEMQAMGAVPEPSGIVLGLAGAAAMYQSLRRRATHPPRSTDLV